MKLLLLSLALVLVLTVGSAQALRLTDGLYFTVAPNSTSEVYFILPDDVGEGLGGKADYYVMTTTTWPDMDLHESTISTEENNTVITPIRFGSRDNKVGNCSTYTITISAPSIQLSKKWSGGVCLSTYMDADVSAKGGDPASVLNSNVDLFSAAFTTNSKNARPSALVPIEIQVQSQATLTIDVTLQSQATLYTKSFVAQTGPASQRVSLMVNASAAAPGSYEITMTARARNCTLSSCTRQSSMVLVVSETAQDGFAISLVPESLSIKDPAPVEFTFTLQNNYKEERIFSVNLEKPIDLDSTFISDYITLPALSEKAVEFTVTPRNQTGFYDMRIVAVSKSVEKYASAYLSVNEMASDVYRNADDAKDNASSATKASVDKAVKSWYSSYSKSDGSNTSGFLSLQEALDAAKKQNQSGPGQTGPQNNTDGPGTTETGPNYLIYLLAAAIPAAVIIAFLFLRKGKSRTEDIKYLDG